MEPAPQAEAEEPEPEIAAQVPPQVEEVEAPPLVTTQPGDDPRVNEKVDEIRFYLAHGMPEQAMAGLAKLQTLWGDAKVVKPQLDSLGLPVEVVPASAERSAACANARTPQPASR